MHFKQRLIVGTWFALWAILASLGVAAMAGFPGGAQATNLFVYSASGVAAAIVWGGLLGKRLLVGDMPLGFWKAAASGFFTALLSLFSFGAFSALGLGMVELIQGQFAQAWERLVVALPAGVALGLWGCLIVGWLVLPLGALAGVALDRFRERLKRL